MRLDRGGFSLEWEDEGRGDPILFSHSMTSNLRMWDPHAARLRARYRVLRWDNRGHGKSDSPPGPYSFRAFADDAAAVLDAAKVDRVHFVGLSVGGMIAQALAVHHPDRVRTLTIVDSCARYPRETIGKWNERAALARVQGMEPIARGVSNNVFPPAFVERAPEVVEGLANLMRQATPAGYALVCEAVPALDYLDALRGVRVPVLVVVGELDRQLPVPLSREMCAVLPDARLVIVPGAGHFVPIERPAEFTALLEDFLKGR